MTFTMIVDQNMAGAQRYLQSFGAVKLVDGRSLCRDDLLQAQALLVRSVTRVDEKLLAGTGIQFVGTATSGVDHIDRKYLLDNNIGFAYAPGSNANSVVEYVLAVIATVDQKLEQLFTGGTVGIVGFGHIGRLLFERLKALGIDSRVYDPWLEPSRLPHISTLAEVLACDVVSVHAELTRKQPWPSYHLLAKRELLQISPKALLINASRGAVVANRALEQRLESTGGPISVLDVWEDEPRVNQKLLGLVRLGTAHIAGYSMDGKLLATRMLRSAMAEHFGVSSNDDASMEGEGAAVLKLSPTAQHTAASCLRSLLQQSYDVTQDDLLLRTGVVDQADAAANFDKLRKSYRTRNELCGRRVQVQNPDKACSKILAAMGCEIEQNLATPQ